MNKVSRISNSYILAGIIIAGYSIISNRIKTINFNDTYFVLPPKDFAIISLLAFMLIALIFSLIEKQIKYSAKSIQFGMFIIPYVYFTLSDLADYNPSYYLANPIAYRWKAIYIPSLLFITLLISLLMLVFLFVKGIYKRFIRPAPNSG